MSNARSGADFERRIVDDLAAMGYYTIRSAGSRGVADVVAFKKGSILMVQCKKNGRISPAERSTLHRTADRFGAEPIIADLIPGDGRARIIRYRTVNGDGFADMTMFYPGDKLWSLDIEARHDREE